MADKKVNCSYVNGSRPDCIDADTKKCETCIYNQAIKQEISYYRKIEVA